MAQRIGFLGAGNMARYLVGGLIQDDYDPNLISVSHYRQDPLDEFAGRFGVNTFRNNSELVAAVDTVVLCVKPQVIATVVTQIAEELASKPCLVLSIAAGIPLSRLQEWINAPVAIVRCMPNSAAMVKCAATALIANPYATDEHKTTAETLMRAVGITQWLNDESQMDIITALSGSGPAYYFYMMETLSNAATEQGLSQQTAQLFTIQTALGAARLALESGIDFVTLRQSVTSKGGTTESALDVMEQQQFADTMTKALDAAVKRSQELGQLVE